MTCLERHLTVKESGGERSEGKGRERWKREIDEKKELE